VIVTAVDVDKRRIALERVNEETAARLRVWTEDEALIGVEHSTPIESE
jgi:hypothetical protein